MQMKPENCGSKTQEANVVFGGMDMRAFFVFCFPMFLLFQFLVKDFRLRSAAGNQTFSDRRPSEVPRIGSPSRVPRLNQSERIVRDTAAYYRVLHKKKSKR